MTTEREIVLKRIREALLHKTNNPFPDIDFESDVYKEMEEPPEISFAEAFIKVSGNFIYCESEQEFVGNLNALMTDKQWGSVFCIEDKIKNILAEGLIPFLSEEDDMHDIVAGVTGCEFLIARLGSIMVSSGQQSGRRMFVYPPVHIVLAYSSQIVPDLKHALAGIKQKYDDKIPSMISVITGPSRTADIEKTLVLGAHGPKEIYLFLVEDSNVS